MPKAAIKLLFWAPRILCIFFAVFVSLFALDVFNGEAPFLEVVLAFLIHLIPTYIIIAVLIVSWRWEWIGAIIFNTLGVLYIVMSRGRFEWRTYLIISGPLFLIGILFLINCIYKRQFKPGR